MNTVLNPMALGQCIYYARAHKGLSQTALAAAVGISRRALYNVEHGRTDPAFSLMARLAHVLDLSLDTLVEDMLDAHE